MWFRRNIADAQTIRTAIAELASSLARLREDHEDLKERFASLRGRVYAAGIHKHPLKDDLPSRDALRKSSGFTPGKPMKHED